MSLLFQECHETSASGVVSQSWSPLAPHPTRIPSPPFFPLFDVLCPDHLHMEAKGDTGGLIHRQRHAKAIWAQNQTLGPSASPI